jgi:hypothetical protein
MSGSRSSGPRSASSAHPLHLRPFKLPGSEAADMEVVPFRLRVPAFGGKLDLEFQLGLGYRPIADGTGDAETRSAPRAVWAPGGQLPAQDCGSSLLSETRFVGHMVDPKPASVGGRREPIMSGAKRPLGTSGR